MLSMIEEAFVGALAKAHADGADEASLIAAIEPALEEARLSVKAIILKELKRKAPGMLRERRAMTAGFEKRNFRRWRKAFDRFEILIVMIEEIGQEHDRDCRPAAKLADDFKFEALAHLLPRALLVAREILCLLRGGYPDAALSRWRSLYELSVVAQFISQHDAAIALRYLASFDFRAVRAAREYNTYAERANLEAFTDAELTELVERADGVAAQIGDRLKKDYDWAHPGLLGRFPTLKPDKVDFAHIEQCVQMDHWRPRFRWANQHVHAGFRPHSTLLGACEAREPVALVGPSNSGFVDPLQMGAISLVHVATAFLFCAPNLDRIVVTEMLIEIRDEIADIAIRLESETLKAQREVEAAQAK